MRRVGLYSPGWPQTPRWVLPATYSSMRVEQLFSRKPLSSSELNTFYAKRARTPEITRQVLEAVAWWEQKAIAAGENIRKANPSPGNIAGGITTLEEKSLGCIYKAGTSPSKRLSPTHLTPRRKGWSTWIPRPMISSNLPAWWPEACRSSSLPQGEGHPWDHPSHRSSRLQGTGTRTSR